MVAALARRVGDRGPDGATHVNEDLEEGHARWQEPPGRRLGGRTEPGGFEEWETGGGRSQEARLAGLRPMGP